MSFGFEDVVLEGDVLTLGDIVIEEVSFPVDVSAIWDVERGGYFFQLFFELWRYDVVSESYSFVGRYVGFWINMTT